jgi:hypothetical protein
VTEQELVARAEDLIRAWNDRDVDRIVVAHRVDATIRALPDGLSGTGREAVRADAERLLGAVPDLRLELRRTTVGSNVVVQECVARGTDGGGRFNRDVIAIAEFDAVGRIATFTRYW